MIGSVRGLVAAAVIAVALAIALAIDLGHAPGARDRALIAGFDGAQVTELIWERPGQPEIRVVRSAQTWRMVAPSQAPADPDAIGQVVAALRGARWHRRGPAGPVHATLTIVAGSDRRALGLGEALAGSDQRWVRDGDRGALVDGWVVRALDRDVLALRVRAPFAELGSGQAIAITATAGDGHGVELALAPRPWRLVRPIAVVLDRELGDQLERAIRAITVVRIPDRAAAPARPSSQPAVERSSPGPSAPPVELVIRVGTPDLGTPPGAAAGRSPGAAGGELRIALAGGCPGAPELVAVAGTTGDGCIERGAAQAIERAVGQLQQPAAAIAERRPIPFEPQRIVLGDAAVVEPSPPRIDGAAADPARIAELVFALASPAEIAALPAGPAIHQLAIRDRAGLEVVLDLFAERVVARHGEPIALRPAPGAWDALVRRSRELREPALWLEEPTAITELRIAPIAGSGARLGAPPAPELRYRRAAVIGAWTRARVDPAASGPVGPADGQSAGAAARQAVGPVGQPVAAADALIVEAVVALLAAPRSLGWLDAAAPPVVRVAISVTPPVGAGTEHVIELGAARASGCPARVDRDGFVLPAALCAQIAALLR
jgi:hypothetical protein